VTQADLLDEEGAAAIADEMDPEEAKDVDLLEALAVEQYGTQRRALRQVLRRAHLADIIIADVEQRLVRLGTLDSSNSGARGKLMGFILGRKWDVA
jgi:hypothetical protein